MSPPAAAPKTRQVPPRFDMDTFKGRFLHYFNTFDPMTLLASKERIMECKSIVDDYKAGSDKHDLNTVWAANKIVQSAVHPDTQKIVPQVFRMAGYLPYNAPVTVGMLIPNASMATTIFFQWLNQTQNAGLNYCNRPIDKNQANKKAEGVKIPFLADPMPTKMFKAYAGAVTAALTASLGLKAIVAKTAPKMSPVLGKICVLSVPFAAVVCANSLNLSIMRSQELVSGIEIKDEKGHVLGMSKAAAKKAIVQTTLSRCFLSAELLLLPQAVITALETVPRLGPAIQTSQKVWWATQMCVMATCFLVGLPASIALFPPNGEIKNKDLEAGHPLKNPATPNVKYIYSKGL